MNSKVILRLILACTLFAGLQACQKDYQAPVIDSVWINMVTRPVEEVDCAYPGQTLCIRGSHLGDLKRVIVNGTDINLNTLFVYESTTAITFTLPADVKTTGDYIRVVTKWGMDEFPFVVRPKTEMPVISGFSTTTLIPGKALTITGANLEGVTEVWLPLTFDGSVACELYGRQPADGKTVQIIIPDNVSFATGRCEIIMTKNDAARGLEYTEKVFSDKTDFRN